MRAVRGLRVWMLWLGVIAILAHGGADRAVGQSSGRTGTLIPIPFRTYVAFNPSMVVFDFGAVEVESGVAQGVTIGGVGSYMAMNREHYASGDFNLRYYPGEVVLRGLSLGLSAGLLRYSKRDSTGGRPAITSPTVGLRGDYNWLIGPSPRFVVGTGLGVKRVLAGAADRSRVDIGRSYFTARFVVGYAF
jgi:hypothetical protein